MKNILSILVILSFFLFLETLYAKEKELVFIVNTKSPFETKISKDIIKDIYLGKIKFEQKIKILPVNQKDKEILKIFLEKFIGMTETAYKKYWVKKVFVEGGIGPVVLDNSKAIVDYVSENTGSIAYLWDTDLSGKEENLKTILIEEKKE